MKIFKLSPFVEKQFKQSPDLSDLMAGDFDLEKDWVEFKKKNSHLDIFSLPRAYRQSRLALIAAKDSLFENPTDHRITLKLTSQLARLMIQYAYEIATNEFKNKHGNIINNKGQVQNFIIYALGKLGGNELNYSSDVDLVFCYTDNGESDGKKCIDSQDYFNRLGRRIIQILDSFTNNGIVYRVDMRLRPFGSAAPLTCRCTNLLDYLETEGRDWERYAWLRASLVAGDTLIGEATLNKIQPFIYRKYLDYTIFESLRQIKAQISRNQLDDVDNLKLGTGGIREIEFIVQTLQLTFAGRNKQLRGNDLWKQMHNLHNHQHLNDEELKQLSSAWLFLRKIENLCQIIHDSDSHSLPNEITNLSLCMGMRDQEVLITLLNTHRQNVHQIFDQLFINNKNTQDKEHTNADIQQIKDQISKKNYPKTNKHKMYAALDVLVPYLHKDKNKILINRYQKVINAVSKRPNYLSMLIESPLILEKLIQQLNHSEYFSTAIAKTPTLLELLFDNLDSKDFDMPNQWSLFVTKFKVGDEENYLELLCQFKQRIQFKAIMAYVDGLLNSVQTCEILTNLAQFILTHIIELAWKSAQQKSACDIRLDDLFVIAYGSMAMQTMHLNSDFDLVFILDQNINDDNHKFIMRWIKRIIHLLSIKTYSGSLYDLDTQLRPNGKSGAAIVTKSNFENYQLNQAWLWEHAALIKSKVIIATKSQQKWFKELRKRILCKQRNPTHVSEELGEMAKKLDLIGNNNHHQEFKFLGQILIKAHNNSKMIDNIQINKGVIKSKLDYSIYR
ncbi:MAG: hypothetical protein AB8B80_16920 [Marinicellaceae bacterium]